MANYLTMDENDVTGLESQFNEAFYVPAKFNWQSRRALFHWIETEHLQDQLAGPLYSIVHSGGCNYVYARDDFPDVDNPAALRHLLLQWHSQMIEIIDNFVPTSSAESADLASMRQFASGMGKVVETACDIERRRWESARVRKA